MKQAPLPKSHRRSVWCLVAGACLWIGASAAPAPATIQLNVTRVGFPTLRRGDVVRSGQWATVVVDLDLDNESGFDGSLRVGQLDADGDEVFDRVEVHLRAETGGSQRYYLYAPANLRGRQNRFIVELFDDLGESVQVVSQGELTDQSMPAEPSQSISDDDLLILSVSTGAIGRVQDLVDADHQSLYHRAIHIGHISPNDLPEHWIGLETVDYIVWDDARAEELTERQRSALVNWVEQGGTLLIAASRTAAALRQVPTIHDVLPVDLGEVHSVENLPELRRAMLGDDASDGESRRSPRTGEWWTTPFPVPVALVTTTLRKGAQRFPSKVSEGPLVLARRRLGRGWVFFSGVVLRDLFSGRGQPVEFFRQLFRLRVVSQDGRATPIPRSLFETVSGAVSFVKSGTVYLLLAGLFSVAYVMTATIGSWLVLGVRGWRKHSWSVFAVVALGASVLSVVIVNGIRGFGGEKLHQISIVDAVAGSGYGYATTFFGLKTGLDRRLDLWLPSDPLTATEPGVSECFLRPIPVGNDQYDVSPGFANPEEYRIAPASAVVRNVRIRATLKRFEGRWAGLLGGSLTAEVTLKGSDIVEGSYIANNLGVELKDCYILQTILNASDVGTTRDLSIYAYPIGTIPVGGSRIDLAAACYQAGGDETKVQVKSKHRLATSQRAWEDKLSTGLRSFASGSFSDTSMVPGQEKNALLLASTIGEYDPTSLAGAAQAWMGLQTWSRDRLRQLDMRAQLTKDTVILIGFADAPGPARLFRRTGDHDWRMLEPDPQKSWTMYRILIPAKIIDDGSEEEPVTPA